jgi:type II secretory pathway pseudopilin PulG
MSDVFAVGKFFLVAASFASCGSANSAPTPSISTTPVRVTASSASAPSSASLLVTVDGLDSKTLDAIPLTDPKDISEAATTPPVVTFGKPLPLPASGTKRSWVLPFSVASMPASAELTRYVAMKLGDVVWNLSYQLSSPAAVTATWAFKPIPVPVRAIGPDGAVPLNVSVTGLAPIVGFQMAAVEFVEQGRKHALAGGRLALCETPAPCLGAPITSLTAGPNTVWLTQRGSGTDHENFWPGKYEGVVTLTSNDKPAGESANLTIYVTAWYWQVAGFVIILLGIAAAFYFMTFLRQRLAREQLLMAAVILRAAVDALSRVLSRLNPPVPTPNIKTKFNDLDEALSDEKLEEHGLPFASPLPWQSPGAATNVDTFRTYIAPVSAWVTALQTIVRTGVVPLVKRKDEFVATNGALNAAQQAAFDNALGALDRLAGPGSAPDAAILVGNIKIQVDAFATTLPPIPLAGPRGPGAAAVQATRSPKQLRMRIALDGLLAWGFIGTVTALAGTYILVFSNPGFGTCLDLLGCLLWGLGLPTGTLLASTTTSSIATTLNVSH